MFTQEIDTPPSADALPDGLFAGIIEAYSHRAFGRGYEVAVTELIGAVLPATEVFIRRNPHLSEETRETLYRFERFLARRFDSVIRGEHWMEGGAGI